VRSGVSIFLTVPRACRRHLAAPKPFRSGGFGLARPSGTSFAISAAFERRCRWRTP